MAGIEATNQDATSMAEPGAGIIADPNPAATKAAGIELPKMPAGPIVQDDASAQPADTSGGLHITITPRPQPDPNAIGQVRQDIADEIAQNNQHAVKVTDALSKGYSGNEVSAYLQKTEGLAPHEADFAVVDSVAQKIKQAKAAGYEDNEVKNFLINSKYDAKIVDQADKVAGVKMPWKALEYTPTGDQQVDATNLADLYTNVYEKHTDTLAKLTSALPFGNAIPGIFSEEAGIQARKDVNELNLGIVSKLKENGIDASIGLQGSEFPGQVVMKDASGRLTPVESSALNSMWNSANENVGFAAGATAGGLAGAELGAAAGSVVPVIGTAIGGVAGAVIGSAIGAGAGSMLGRSKDLAINAAKLSEDLSTKLYMTQIAQTGMANATMDVIGAGAIKTISTAAKTMMDAYKYTLGGNIKGSVKLLKSITGLTDDQANEIANNWYNSLDKKPAIATRTGMNRITLGVIPKGSRALTQDEKIVAGIANTVPGVENFVGRAASENAKLAQNLKTQISERANSLMKVVSQSADENIGSLMRNDLLAYEKDVKDFYGMVKSEAGKAIDGTDFKFDYDKLAIQPVLKKIEQQITDPSMMQRFALYTTKIGNASAIRDFSGLLDLRQEVNNFKYNIAKNLSFHATEAVNTVLNKIDTLVAKTAKEYMTDGNQWLKNFALAKSEYSKMLMLEENAMYKSVNSTKATEQSIQKAISHYANNKDVDMETFNKVVERLTPTTRAKVETVAIKNLVDKFTLGKGTDLQAINFPALNNAVKDLNIKTPVAKGITQIIDDIAKVYKNDATLSGINTGTNAKGSSGGMGKSIYGRAEVAVISKAFDYMSRLLPTARAHNVALISNIDKLLQNPLHVITAEQLIKKFPRTMTEEVKSLVKNLQIQWAAAGNKAQPMIHMYNQSKDGVAKVTSGAFGKGIYLFEKVANKDPMMETFRHPVIPSKMASLDDISKVLGRTIEAKDIRTIPNLQQQLSDKGYLGIKIDNKAMVFTENTVGAKPAVKISTSKETLEPMQLVKDGFGFTQFHNREIALVGGVRTGKVGSTNTARLRYDIYDKDKILSNNDWSKAKIGTSELNIYTDKEGNLTNKIEGIVNLEINKELRNKGLGSKIVSSIKANVNKELHIYDVQNKATKFWEKQGAKIIKNNINRSGYTDMIIK